MKLIFAPEAWEDYRCWPATDQKAVRRIHELSRDTTRSPFSGIGKAKLDGVEIFEDFAVGVVDGAMTLIDDDEVEKMR